MNEVLSSKFKNMGFVAAVLVVGLHLGHPAQSGTSGWYLISALEYLCGWCVPYFFFASGYFVSAHMSEAGWWKRESAKRVYTILAPFLIWSLLFFAFVAVETGMADYLAKRELFSTLRLLMRGSVLSIFGLDFRIVPFYAQLWFLRSLYILILLSPILALLVRRCGFVGLLVLFVLYHQFGSDDAFLNQNIVWLRCTLSLKGAFFMAFGMWFRFHHNDVLIYGGRGRMPIAVLAATIGSLMSLYAINIKINSAPDGQIVNVSCFTNLIFLVSFWLIIGSRRWTSVITSTAFPIYLIHVFYMIIFDACISKRIDIVWVVVAKYLFALCLSIGTALVIRLVMKSKSRFLYGGR